MSSNRAAASGGATPGAPSPAIVARARARGQWLHAPGGGDVVRHLLAVQAQDAASVPYALQARGGAFREGLLITWLMRSTLHLVDAEDLAWLHPLFAPRMATANARRLAQLGVTKDHTDAIVAALPATRAELAARFDLPGQALPHALHRAAIAGRLAMTPERLIIPIEVKWRAPDLDELARRYYACHAGADQRDLAYWSGLPLRDCRPPASTELEDGPVPDVLIPPFDELLLGWRDRTPTVPAEHAKRVHPGGGILRAVALEDGVAVGTWSRAGGRISVEGF
ncbi:winged helix DNA-binding domain-containing protein [Solirubrobacter taibaiensis]|nr:winged helix DNA-binding domain-containing protein [Solirubrobacter taibaiensis]